ncbi:MAG: alpha/beta fold hydrolase [Phycisphaerae bacterium]|nr:alpha/beta fold hydrolase [Phycisphaerae bacterium]
MKPLLSLIFLLPGITILAGCPFQERSFPLQRDGIVRVPPPLDHQRSARPWLVNAQRKLAPLLPAAKYGLSPMLTADMTGPTSQPVDMVKHFHIRTWGLESIWVNFLGLAYSAQAISTADTRTPAPPWPGFEDIWVPIDDHVKLAGRFGLARSADGAVRDADCIVLLPGLRGTNVVLRQRDLARGLRDSGFHVLTLELRGQGQTDQAYPNVPNTWGILEIDDLLRVADWLQRQPHVRRTGLVGFSWSANEALLVAWREGRRSGHPCISPELAKRHRPVEGGPYYQAGIVAFSAVLNFEDLLDELEIERQGFFNPMLAGLQDTVRERKIDKNYAEKTGSLRKLFDFERLDYPDSVRDGLRYLRLLGYKGERCDRKLASARMPVLMVHAADDPIVPAQAVADFVTGLSNPNVAAIVLPSGGHIGFAPYSSPWYYSLLLNFFDPATGPAPASP